MKKYDLETECKKAIEILDKKYKIKAEYIIEMNMKYFSRCITIITRDFDYLIILSHLHEENMKAEEMVEEFISSYNGLAT